MSEFHTRKAKTFTFFTVDTNLYARKVTFFQAQEPMKGRKNALHKAKVSLYLHHTLKLKMKKSGKKTVEDLNLVHPKSAAASKRLCSITDRNSE